MVRAEDGLMSIPADFFFFFFESGCLPGLDVSLLFGEERLLSSLALSGLKDQTTQIQKSLCGNIREVGADRAGVATC